MIIKNIKMYSASGILTVSPPIKEGMEKITPKALTKPEASPVRDRAKILPMASSLLLIGEISIEANVPLSFSPAIDSGQIDIAVEKSKDIVIIGKMKDITCFPNADASPTFGLVLMFIE